MTSINASATKKRIRSARHFLIGAFLVVAMMLPAWTRTHAQESSYRIEPVSLEQGVSHNLIYCIHQDRSGFLWLGTMFGLVKYDGYTYTTYRHDPLDSNSLSNDDILAIHEDEQENLWIGTYGGGLNRLDRATGKIVRYVHEPLDSTSIAHNVVWAICEDRAGMLWIGTASGLNRFDRKRQQFTRYQRNAANPNSLPSDTVLAICEDGAGQLWVGTVGGLSQFDRPNKRFIHYRHDPDDPKSVSRGAVKTIFTDSAGELWIGTEGGLNRFVLAPEEFVHYQHDPANPASLSGNSINTIYEDIAGSLWIGTARGLSKFDRAKETFTHFFDNRSGANTNSSGIITAIHQDNSGLFWIGTYHSGLLRMHSGTCKFVCYRSISADTTSLRHNRVQALHEDRVGKTWIGTVNGLDALDEEKQQFAHYALASGRHHARLGNVVNAIYADKSNALWISTLRGLNRFDPDRKRCKLFQHDPADSNSLSNNAVTAFCEDESGVLWMGTAAGLNRFEQRTEKFTRFVLDSTGPANHILSLYQDVTGVLWIGTYGGLIRFDPAQKSMARFQQNPNDPHSLSNNYCFAIGEDSEGVLWIGTGGGLERLDRATGTFTHFTEKDGLPNSVICGIVAGKNGVLWLSTHKGLSRFYTRARTFTNYDLADGLQSNMFIPGAYGKRRNGELLFGGINGFNRFHPDSLKANPYIPPVAITAFKIFDKTHKFAGDISSTQTLELSHQENFFTFEFAALDFTRPEKNQYAYKLEGVDRDWIYAGTRRDASYTEAAPGEYVFRVKGSNSDGVWNETGSAVRISIAPPFWKTPWFAALCAGAAVVLFMLAHHYRVRAKLKQFQEVESARRLENEQVRKKAANDFHDELGHRLTKIALFSEIVKRKLNGASEEITAYLDKIIDASQNLVNDTRDFIWTLDPGKDSLHEVIIYLKDFAEELFDRTAIAFQIHGLSPELEEIKLSTDAKRHLTLIFKEGLNNALKHAECKLVTLAVERQDDRLVITLADDGKGCNGNMNGVGQGLKNMQERAEKIHGDLQILSSPTRNGTTLQLNIVLNGDAQTQ